MRRDPTVGIPADEILRLAILGAAALRPGLMESERRAQLDLQNNAGLIEELRSQLAQLEKGHQKQPKRIEASRYGWSDDAEERRKEMKRRIAKRRANGAAAKAATHPRDPNHPDHEKWRKAVRRASRKRWNSLSDAEQQSRIRKMLRGRRRQEQGRKTESVRSMLSKPAPPEQKAAAA